MMGENARHTQESAVAFLRGTHTRRVDGAEQSITISQVRITSQPVGAMFDYPLTDEGERPPDRRVAFKGEIGILEPILKT